MTLTHPNPKEKVERPAKAWRNKWFNFFAFKYEDGTWSKEGEQWGFLTFPSKEVAEQRAREWLATEALDGCSLYIGAFPISQEG